MMFLEITPATFFVGLAIIMLALVAVRRLRRRGTCDCHHGGAGKALGGCVGCSGCGAADRMLEDMDSAANKTSITQQ